MPLSISIAPGSPTPVYRQIVEQVCAAVISGDLKEDEPLPSVRVLAEELVLNANTVARAYSELAREGIVESRGTRGSFVLPRRQLYTRSERRRRIEPALKAFISEALLLGYSNEEIVAQVEEMAEELAPARNDKPRGGSR
jgi:GntR family transcriptional regulator